MPENPYFCSVSCFAYNSEAGCSQRIASVLTTAGCVWAFTAQSVALSQGSTRASDCLLNLAFLATNDACMTGGQLSGEFALENANASDNVVIDVPSDSSSESPPSARRVHPLPLHRVRGAGDVLHRVRGAGDVLHVLIVFVELEMWNLQRVSN